MRSGTPQAIRTHQTLSFSWNSPSPARLSVVCFLSCLPTVCTFEDQREGVVLSQLAFLLPCYPQPLSRRVFNAHAVLFLTINHFYRNPPARYRPASSRLPRLLYDSYSPRAEENFRQLCTGEYRPSGAPVGYKGNRVHRIMPGFLMQGGDMTVGDGSGTGGGIYGGGAPFADDPFGLTATHSGGPGLLCSAAVERNANGSQWFVTLGEGAAGAGSLDGQHALFGKVVGGMDVVRAVGGVHVTGAGMPTSEVLVSECGEM